MRRSIVPILLMFLSLEANAVESIVIEFPEDNVVILPGECAIAGDGAYTCDIDDYHGRVYLDDVNKVRDSYLNLPVQTKVHDGFWVPMNTLHTKILGKEHFASTLLATGNNFITYIYSICNEVNCLQAVSNRREFIQKVMHQISSQLVQTY